MGKDGEKKDGTDSREGLKAEHTRLVAQETTLNAKHEEVKALFKGLEDTYAASKESFSVNRYGQLKDMIKNTANEKVISGIRNTIQQSQNTGSKGGGMNALLKRAQEFSSESQAQEETAKPSSGKGGKVSGFMKKLKNMTGFSDEPITDEDVMSNTDLQRDNGRKQRAISRHQTQLGKAASKLEKLQQKYQASKAHAPPKRYQELKDMIKECVAEKL